jgi:2-polyprenyl-6-methoxyphenol hydroxylase-like FAD-dependent oxidoreductase
MSAKTVLISGAGIAGPTLAFWLKAAGFEPTIVERASELRRGGYVIDFWGLGYDIAERMGLTREIDRVGYHVRELRIVNANSERIAGFGTNVFIELTGGRYVTIERSALSQLLFEKIKDTTEIIFGNEIVAVQDLADHVLVKLKHGAERRFDLVIGADGLHSAIRRLVFGPQDAFEKRFGYIVAAFEVSGYRPRDQDVYVVYNTPGRMLGRIALHDDRTLFLFVLAADADMTLLDLSGQKAILRNKFADRKWECERILDELARAKELYFDRVSQIKINRWSRGRIALVGDAAFCVSLLAGQGSALAMVAAFVLAGELSEAGGRHEQAFANYERILRAYISVKQRGAKRFASAFVPKTRCGLFFRNQVIIVSGMPRIARLTFGRDIIDTLQLPTYRWPALELRIG